VGPPGLLATQYVARPSGRRRYAATFSRIAIAMLGSDLGPSEGPLPTQSGHTSDRVVTGRY